MLSLKKYGVITVIANTFVVQTIYSDENSEKVKKYLKKHKLPHEIEPYNYKNKKGVKVRYIANYRHLKRLHAIVLRNNMAKMQEELDFIDNLKK